MEIPAEITKPIQKETNRSIDKCKQIHFMWVSGHINSPGNEKQTN